MGDEVVLVAHNLRLTDTEDRNGLVYIDVDGYPHLHLYTTFAPARRKLTPKGSPTSGAEPDGGHGQQPLRSLPVRLEADNVPEGGLLKFGFDRDNDGQRLARQNEIVELPPGAHQHRFSYEVQKDGGILLVGTTEDWVYNLNTADIFGTRKLRLGMLTRSGAFIHAGEKQWCRWNTPPGRRRIPGGTRAACSRK